MVAGPWTAAQRHLRRRDGILAALINRVGPCTLQPGGDPFAVLVRSVIAQLILTAAARTIEKRLLALVASPGFSPASIIPLPDDRLRGVGLSAAKTSTIKELAIRSLDGRLPLDALIQWDDHQIVSALTTIRGIGPWTTMMFLMFGLGRPDVLPVGDFGLRSGVRDLYRLDGLPTPAQLTTIAELWRPWRSIATWYIWRSRGPVPQS